MSERNKERIFLKLIIGCYFVAIVLSFMRIYVFHAYPVYSSEDDMPGAWDTITDIPSLLTQ